MFAIYKLRIHAHEIQLFYYYYWKHLGLCKYAPDMKIYNNTKYIILLRTKRITYHLIYTTLQYLAKVVW